MSAIRDYKIHGDTVVVMRETEADLFSTQFPVWVTRAGRDHQAEYAGVLMHMTAGKFAGQFTYEHPKRRGQPGRYFTDELSALESLMHFHILGRHITQKGD